MYTGHDFALDMLRLTTKHGRPLTYDENDIWYQYFVEEAAAVGHKLPMTATLGRLALTESRRSHDDIETEVAMLNEAYRTIPNGGNGPIVGAVALTAVRKVMRAQGPVFLSSWSLGVTLHKYGDVALNTLELRVGSAEGQEALERFGVVDLLSKQTDDGYLTLDPAKDHILHDDQLVSLRAYVESAFQS